MLVEAPALNVMHICYIKVRLEHNLWSLILNNRNDWPQCVVPVTAYILLERMAQSDTNKHCPPQCQQSWAISLGPLPDCQVFG